MVALITLTTAGVDAGPFNLFSDVDGFTVPFGPSVSAAVLLAGYLTADVPYGTTIVRIKSTGDCKNYIDVPLEFPPPMDCGISVSLNVIGGSAGVEDNFINLNPQGGVVSVITLASISVSKFELIHNGSKKATSAMTGLNEGPFENVWGMSEDYSIPTEAQAAALDQFIGPPKGAIPTRNAEYLAETGINYISAAAGRQMLWWVYSPADYVINTQVVLRITGSTTASFLATNMCETTTTSTTAAPGMFNMVRSIGVSSTTSACASSTFVDPVKSNAEFPFNGDNVFEPDGVTPFNGANLWYMFQHMPEIIFKIDATGLIIQAEYCP